MPRRTAELLAVVLVAAATAAAGSRRVDLQLRLPPELDLKGTEKIYVGPVLLEPQAVGDTAKRVDVNAVREFEQYVRALIRRQTRLELLPEAEDVRPPTHDPTVLADDEEFWRQLGEATGADYILAAFIDVKVLDRSGYTTEKYVSPEDGKTYFRQVLVEETGFSYDILLLVFTGDGELALERQITDFRERPARRLDEFEDMYDDLYHLENGLLGIFVPRSVRARRYLYTG